MEEFLKSIFLNSEVEFQYIDAWYEVFHKDYKATVEDVKDTLLVVIKDCKVDVNKLTNDIYNRAKNHEDLNRLLEVYNSEVSDSNLVLCKAIGEKRRKNIQSYIDALEKAIKSKEEEKKVFESWL